MADLLVEMAWEPERLREKVGGAFGFDDREIKGNLERFEGVLAAAARRAPGPVSSTSTRPASGRLRPAAGSRGRHLLGGSCAKFMSGAAETRATARLPGRGAVGSACACAPDQAPG